MSGVGTPTPDSMATSSFRLHNHWAPPALAPPPPPPAHHRRLVLPGVVAPLLFPFPLMTPRPFDTRPGPRPPHW